MRRSPTFTPGGLGAQLDDAADDLVAHGQRQDDAAIVQRHLLAAADVVIALPDVQVGVADAAMGDLEQDLGALRFRRRQFDFLKRLSVFDDGPCAHVGLLLSGVGRMDSAWRGLRKDVVPNYQGRGP